MRCGRHITFMGPVLNVVSNSYGVEPFGVGFTHPYGRPHQSIGKHSVHVKITFQGFISHNIRDVDFISDLSR